jgi:uncharacterized delta-60 repeat protein/uncharacterized repeat protein (TIGR01451 family)
MLWALFFLVLTAPGLLAQQPVNDYFMDAITLTGPSGSINGNNANADFPEVGEPEHGGPGGFSVWYQWTAPEDGTVFFSTSGASFNTLLAAYTGTSVDALTLVAANDDAVGQPPGIDSYIEFDAVAGTTYHIAVDGLFGGTGDFTLNWGTPGAGPGQGGGIAGQFNFTSKLYSVTENETIPSFWGLPASGNPAEVPGALITVTRTGGDAGQVMVDYFTRYISITNVVMTNIVTTNMMGMTVTNSALVTNVVDSATPFFDFLPVEGTLVFDHYQMSTNFIVPVFSDFQSNGLKFLYVVLTNARPALEENPAVIAPFIGMTNEAELDIQEVNEEFKTFAIERATYALSEQGGSIGVDVIFPSLPMDSGSVTLNVAGGAYGFRLSAGSDYADTGNFLFPNTPLTDGSLPITNFMDLAVFSQRLDFPAGVKRVRTRIPINDDNIVEFNEDFLVYLSNPSGGAISPGGASANVTILYDEQPAGALDREWNPDQISTTIPPFNFKPGANSEVFAVAMQTDQKTVIGGDFTAYNTVPRNRIARINVDGSLDTTFNPGSGADGFVSALYSYPVTGSNTNDQNKVVLGGAFTSINNIQRNGIARLNPDGSLDTTFDPGQGFDGVVRSLAVVDSDKIVAVGDFTSFNGIPRRGIARLNDNGTLDLAFDPGAGADGTIWSVDVDNTSSAIQIDAGQFGVGPAEYRTNIETGARSGVLTVVFAPACVPDRLTVYYGPNQIFDSGLTNEYMGDPFCDFTNYTGPITYIIPYGPGPYTDLTIVVNEGSGDPGTVWEFFATIENEVAGQHLYLGGEFTSIDGVPRLGVARLNPNGSVDPNFDPGGGVNGPVYAVGVQGDLKVLVGGHFNMVDFRARPSIARLNADGSLDTGFEPGDGFDDSVYSITLQPDDKAMVGGIFTSYDGARRLGIARLLTNGVLDTSFMDTAYNQFAGVPKTFSFEPNNFVNAIALQANGDVMIGGSFTNVGGNAFFEAPYSRDWTRENKRTRFNVARLIGGATPGPGSLEFAYDSYTADENGGLFSVRLQRVNGRLGTISAVLNTSNRVALDSLDYTATTSTNYWIEWAYVAPKSVGFVGYRFPVLPIIDDNLIEGDETLDLILSNPAGSINLGGEIVPLGGTRSRFRVPMTIVDNDFDHGTLVFEKPEFTVNENEIQGTVNVIRTNGSVGVVSVNYFTLDGTATAGLDYTARQGTLTFASGQTNRSFNITIKNDLIVEDDETIVLVMTNATGGAILPGGLPTSTTTSVLKIIDDDFAPGHVNFASTNFDGIEGSKVVNVTVNRTGGNVGQVSVQIAAQTGSAMNGVDFIGLTNTLTWVDGDTSPRVVSISVLDDGLVEGPETINLSLINPSIPLLIGSLGAATGTIVDDDFYGNLAFSQPVYEADENGTNALITVVRFGGVGETVMVDYHVLPGTAVPMTDYVPTNGTLTFFAGETAKSFSITLFDDAIKQATNKTVQLSLDNVQLATLADPKEAVLTIIDNESFNIPAGTLDTTFDPTAGANADIFSTALQPDGKLIVGGDFTILNNIRRNRLARLLPDGTLDLTFNVGVGPNQPVRKVLLQPDGKILLGGFFTTLHSTNRNHIARINEDGTLDGFFNPGAGADNPIFDLALMEDGKIVIGGSFNTYNGVSRPYFAVLNTNGTLNTSFNPGVGADDTVNAVAVQRDGKVLIGGDFTSVNNVPRRGIARLNADGSVDRSFEPGKGANGSVRTITVQSDGSILVGGSFTAVNDTDRRYLARLNPDGTVDATFLNGLAGADNVVLDIVQQLDGKLVVVGDFTTFNAVTRHRITRLNPNGSTDPTINFGEGANAFISSVLIQPDRKIVIAGGFTIFNQQPRNRVARLHGGSIAGPGRIEFNSPFYTVLETQPEKEIVVRRIGGTTGEASVNFQTVDFGSATALADYIPTNGNLVFPEGEVLRTFKVPILDDSLVEPDESVLLLLETNGTSGVTLGPQPVATLRIVSDDSVLSFLTAAFSVNENVIGGFATITVVRTGTTNTAVSVDYLSSDGTATPVADYTPVHATLNFEPGETLKTFFVPIVNDSLVEGNETVQLSLTNATSGVSLGVAQSTLQIVDDDFARGVLNFSPSAYVVNEYETNVVVTVVRTNGSTGVISVKYATSDGTARAGQDYFPASGSLTFADGETVKSFNVPIIPDFVAETNETVFLALSEPTGGATLGAGTAAILTIIDNELIHGSLSFSAPNYSVVESNLTVTLSVARSFGNLGPITVDYATRDGTALAGSDYTAATGTLTWNDGDFSPKPLTVTILNDSVVEGTESFSLTLTKPTGGATLGSRPSATVTVQDDDFGPGFLSFIAADYFVGEDATNAVISVVRTFGQSGPVSVGFSTVSGGTAVPGFDFVSTNGTLNFGDGDTNLSFQVRILDNLVVEGDKTIGLILSNVRGGASLTGQITNAVLTIRENDQQSGSIDASFNALGANGPVRTLLLRTNNNKIYVGGDFLLFNSVPRSHIARLNPNGTLDTGFDPGSTFNNSALAMSVLANSQILVGGTFTGVGGSNNFLARLNNDGTLDTNFMAGLTGVDNAVYAIAEQSDGRIVVGGSFTGVNGNPRDRIARLNPGGSLDPNFNPSASADGLVRVIRVHMDGRMLLAGDFTTVNGAPRGRIAQLNSDGTLDTSFTPGLGANDSIRSMVVQDNGKILIGGLFTNYNGTVRVRLARLNANGSIDSTFNPGLGANEFVSTVALQSDGRILIGGGFTLFNGATRNRLTRLNPDGSIDTTINLGTGANNFISTVVVQPDRKILIGGGFTTFDDQPRNFIARLNGGVNIGSGSLVFSAANYNVVENQTNVTITVRRLVGTSNAVSVAYTTTDGTALAGLHYVPTNGMLNFGPGETTARFTVGILDDFTTNADRSFTVRLSNPSGGASLGSPNPATVTILNNDQVVGFDANNYAVSESVGTATIAVRRLGGTVGTLTVTYGTGAGTASSGVDYQDVSGSLVFTNGQSVATFDVPIFDDFLVEGNETVDLTLAGVAGSAVLGVSSATLTIVDNDVSAGQIGFGQPNFTVNEQGVTALITVIRTGGSSGNASVNYQTADGTATAGADYAPAGGLLVFADGEVSKTFAVDIFDDVLVEGDETVNLTLFNAVGSGLGQATSTLTILADEAVFSFATNNFAVVENMTNAAVTVVRSGGGTGPVSVNYFTMDGSALAGLDYTNLMGTLTFAPGETNKTLLIPIVNDNLGELDEFFFVMLTNPVVEAVLGPIDAAVVTIQDDDVSFHFEQPNYLVSEAGGSAAISVVRTGVTNAAGAVSFATSDGTANAGSDYVFTSSVLNFAAGEVRKTVVIPILDDNLGEGNETVNLNLFSPSTGTSLGTPSTALLTIVDDEDTLSFSQATFDVNENATNAFISVVRMGSPSGSVSVAYTVTNGTATAGQDYSVVSGTLVFSTFEVVKTFSIPILDDALPEGDETVRLSLSSPSPTVTLVNPTNATLVIHDDDVSLQFLTPEYAVEEDGTNVVITVTRTGSVKDFLRVGYVSSNGTATAGMDYVGVSNVLVFASGVTNRSFTVPILDDLKIEGDETFFLHLFVSTNTTNAFVLGQPSTTMVTIFDNDSSTMISAGTALISESFLPANGLIDAGERVTVQFGLRNVGNVDTVNLMATLLSSNGVTLPSPVTQSYGPVLAGGSAVSRPFTFTAGGTNGGVVTATLTLRNIGPEDTNDLGTLSFNFSLGRTVRSLANTNGLTINDGTSATPYPSVISVSGLAGNLAQAIVRLNNLSHAFPDDIDILLVGPTGTNVVLMSDAGGGQFNALNNVNLTFDDAAATTLPDSTQIVTSTNRPTNWGVANDPFPAPAPSGPFGSTLSVFNGTDPNGDWRLFVVDDNFQDAGNIAGGWSLTLTTADFVKPSADLSVAVHDTPDPVSPGEVLTYQVGVTNHGPGAAAAMIVTNILSPNVAFVSAASTAGSCSESGGIVTCNVGTVTNGGGVLVTILATAGGTSTISDTATVTSPVQDLNPGNNSATVKTAIMAPSEPTLSITRQGSSVILSWPAAASGFILQEADSLTASGWTPVSATPMPVGDQLQVQVVPSGTKFYRLHHP